MNIRKMKKQKQKKMLVAYSYGVYDDMGFTALLFFWRVRKRPPVSIVLRCSEQGTECWWAIRVVVTFLPHCSSGIS